MKTMGPIMTNKEVAELKLKELIHFYGSDGIGDMDLISGSGIDEMVSLYMASSLGDEVYTDAIDQINARISIMVSKSGEERTIEKIAFATYLLAMARNAAEDYISPLLMDEYFKCQRSIAEENGVSVFEFQAKLTRQLYG